jgi:hypothetical protein
MVLVAESPRATGCLGFCESTQGWSTYSRAKDLPRTHRVSTQSHSPNHQVLQLQFTDMSPIVLTSNTVFGSVIGGTTLRSPRCSPLSHSPQEDKTPRVEE